MPGRSYAAATNGKRATGRAVDGDEGHRTTPAVCTLANGTTALGVLESAEPSMEWQGQVEVNDTDNSVRITSYLLASTPRTTGSI